MTRYIAQRLLLLPFLLLAYSFVIFAIIHAPPGDFLTSYVATLSSSGTSITAEQVKGFSLWVLRAVMSGRGDEVLDLAKTNLLSR